jgi:hypothetical protein
MIAYSTNFEYVLDFRTRQWNILAYQKNILEMQ